MQFTLAELAIILGGISLIFTAQWALHLHFNQQHNRRSEDLHKITHHKLEALKQKFSQDLQDMRQQIKTRTPLGLHHQLRKTLDKRLKQLEHQQHNK